MVRLVMSAWCLLALATALNAQSERFSGALELRLDSAGQLELERRVEHANRTIENPTLEDLLADGPLPREITESAANPGASDGSFLGGPSLMAVVLPSGPSGTDTGYIELFYYQTPSGYDPSGPELPMLMGYHGFGLSAASVHNLSQLDEEANARGWLYASPTGVDDKLFASELSQLHTELVYDYMIANFTVDEDRLYMVGFSMGGGYTHSFAAQHRDPAGLMIAAIGTVSSAVDWTMVYINEGAIIKNLLEWEENFGGSPAEFGDLYQKASALHFLPGSYPPVPGVLVEDRSMAFNNVGIPTYMTYDVNDELEQIPPLNEELHTVLNSTGAPVEFIVTSGTVDSEGMPNEHSWDVLDVVECFDFLEMWTVERMPEDFRALAVENGQISWTKITQRNDPSVLFTPYVAEADVPGRTLSISDLSTATGITLNAADAGLSGTDPIRVEVEFVDSTPILIKLEGFTARPSYLRNAMNGQLIEGVEALIDEDALQLVLNGPVSFSADLFQDATWNSTLRTTPNPVTLEATTALTLDGPLDATLGAVIIGLNEALYVAKGALLGVIPVKVLFLPTDAQGDLSFDIEVSDDPSLAGLRVPLQAALLDAGNLITGVSNMWAIEINELAGP